jgi:sortase A
MGGYESSEEKEVKKRGILLMSIGGVLILTALGLILNHLYEENTANREAEIICSRLIVQIKKEKDSNAAETPEQPAAGETTSGIPDESEVIRSKLTDANPDTIEIDGNKYIGYLSIPDLDLNLPVLSKWSYNSLKISPSRYLDDGTSYGLIIAAHNYARHFGKISSLAEGAVVYFTDVHGVVYSFEVDKQEILNPEDITKMITEPYDLTLFTCTPGGASRVTVRCTYAGSRAE